ncbi:MAG TPA: zinc ribbon domain-containing protein [Anaerolineae bacterium]|nr:zinc ribbon domain-containing protein [Anaerolineae bacterium]HOR01253.1 zinc ribbon domain-containing protein [Anaerolineae bacterium]HPL30432.1 zinc ribbon domain-containing protein [Anaerolineae bacterium]
MTGEKHEAEARCRCPYCNGNTKRSLPVCQLCGAAVVRCSGCGRLLTQQETVCPRCGTRAEPAPDQSTQS